MGAPSTFEDRQERLIEDLNSHEADVKRRFEDAQMRLQVAKNYEAIAKAQNDVQTLAEQVSHHLDRTLADILKSFDAIRDALRAPESHLVGRLEKLEKDNKDLKGEKRTLQSNLQKARDRREFLQAQVTALESENGNLREENRRLKADKEGKEHWDETIRNVNPLRK